MTSPRRRRVYAALAGAALAGSLAACASDADPAATASTTAAEGAGTASEEAAEATEPAEDTGEEAAGDSTYADGSYSATGSYVSPGGSESVAVELTLTDDVVTDVVVTPQATNPNSVRFQGEFADGIADVVVGQPVDELQVSRVAGSSLTSGGFNDALAQILAEASA